MSRWLNTLLLSQEDQFLESGVGVFLEQIALLVNTYEGTANTDLIVPLDTFKQLLLPKLTITLCKCLGNLEGCIL